MDNERPLAKVSYKDLSRVATFFGKRLCDEYDKVNDWRLNLAEDERLTLSLAIWKVLCELKEFGRLRSNSEDLINQASRNMRDYVYRRHPIRLIHLLRAFARRFCPFFKRVTTRKLESSSRLSDPWRFYSGGHEARVKQFDGWSRSLCLQQITAIKEFGDWFVCEYWFDNHEHKEAAIVPFQTLDEAQFFLVQLTDLLNTCGEPDCPEAAQFIREVIAQAPVEKILMARELEALERAKLESRRRTCTYVYVFELDNETVKIGISTDVIRRAAQIQSGGNNVLRLAATINGWSHSEASKIELELHRHFADRRKPKQREFFFVPFDEAKTQLETYSPVIVKNFD